jgi:hypothetical protein
MTVPAALDAASRHRSRATMAGYHMSGWMFRGKDMANPGRWRASGLTLIDRTAPLACEKQRTSCATASMQRGSAVDPSTMRTRAPRAIWGYATVAPQGATAALVLLSLLAQLGGQRQATRYAVTAP